MNILNQPTVKIYSNVQYVYEHNLISGLKIHRVLNLLDCQCFLNCYIIIVNILA